MQALFLVAIAMITFPVAVLAAGAMLGVASVALRALRAVAAGWQGQLQGVARVFAFGLALLRRRLAVASA